MNGDHENDIVVRNLVYKRPNDLVNHYWYENDGDQIFYGYDLTFGTGIVQTVYAKDMDGDSDIDVLSGSGNMIAWYNNDGHQNFSPQIISENEIGVKSICATDINGDTYTDVISASFGNTNDGILKWYRNDGDLYFWPFLIHNFYLVKTVLANHINNDNYIDLIAAGRLGIKWYESNGNGSFTSHIITDSLGNVNSIIADDINGDGAIDIISGSWSGVNYYENDGSGNFSCFTIQDFSYGTAQSVWSKDMESDGDSDVVACFYNRIMWYENDGHHNFNGHVISQDLDNVRSVIAVDIDNDNDADVICQFGYDEILALYINDGNQNFSLQIIAQDVIDVNSIFTTDIDQDGDIDILIGGDKVTWYENLLVNEIPDYYSDNTPVDFILEQNYPNPFNPSTNIEFSLPKSEFVTLKIYNLLGQEVATLVSDKLSSGNYKYTWDASAFSSGIYYYKIQAGSYIQTKKLILLK